MRTRPEKERALAESLFVTEGKSGREIAALLGAGKETVQRWARDGKWMERRRLRRLDSPLASLERLRRERDRLTGTLGGEKAGADKSDAPKAISDTISLIHKLTQTIEKMESHREDDDVGAMLATMEGFATFVVAHTAPEECLAIRKMIEKFFDEERRKSL